jgi:hypothetical protein
VQRAGDLFARVVLGQRQVPRHLAQLRRPVFELGGALLQRRRGTLPVGDVGRERDGPAAARRGNVIQAHFDRKGRAVLPFTNQLKTASHWARTRCSEVIGPMCDVPAADRGRQQPLDRGADQLTRRPAEHRFEGTIGHHDRPMPVDQDDALRCGFQQEPKLADPGGAQGRGIVGLSWIDPERLGGGPGAGQHRCSITADVSRRALQWLRRGTL